MPGLKPLPRPMPWEQWLLWMAANNWSAFVGEAPIQPVKPQERLKL